MSPYRENAVEEAVTVKDTPLWKVMASMLVAGSMVGGLGYLGGNRAPRRPPPCRENYLSDMGDGCAPGGRVELLGNHFICRCPAATDGGAP